MYADLSNWSLFFNCSDKWLKEWKYDISNIILVMYADSLITVLSLITKTHNRQKVITNRTSSFFNHETTKRSLMVLWGLRLKWHKVWVLFIGDDVAIGSDGVWVLKHWPLPVGRHKSCHHYEYVYFYSVAARSHW